MPAVILNPIMRKPTTYLLSAGVLFGEGIYDLREMSSEQFFQKIEDGGAEIDCRIRNRDVLNYINRRTKLNFRQNGRPIKIKDRDQLLIMRLRDYQPGASRERVTRDLDVRWYQFFFCTYFKGVLTRKR